jgi:hypothetical protein
MAGGYLQLRADHPLIAAAPELFHLPAQVFFQKIFREQWRARSFPRMRENRDFRLFRGVLGDSSLLGSFWDRVQQVINVNTLD